MKVAYSTATISFLPNAYILADSFLNHHPHYLFIIFLIDPLDDHANPFKRKNLVIISIENLALDGLPGMLKNLSISEICFSLKPILAEYLIKNKPGLSHLFYFDSDIRIYRSLKEAEHLLETHDLVLTPHFTNPVRDDKVPSELDILRTGIYNMGFAGFRHSENTLKILQWWKQRVLQYGFENRDLGLSADQTWMNLAPVLFDNTATINHPGYNFAYWNIHERELRWSEGNFSVNEQELKFAHFADFDPHRPEYFTHPKHFNRLLPGENPALTRLCADYAHELLTNNFDNYCTIRSEYAVSRQEQARQKMIYPGEGESRTKQLIIWLSCLLPAGIRRFSRKTSLFIIRHIK